MSKTYRIAECASSGWNVLEELHGVISSATKPIAWFRDPREAEEYRDGKTEREKLLAVNVVDDALEPGEGSNDLPPQQKGRIVAYDVITSNNVDTITRVVHISLCSGWEPLGGICATATGFHQAVVKRS